MRKILSVIILVYIELSTFGQTNSEVLNKAKELINTKKYSSAFKLLNDFDSKNEMPDIVLEKEDIALNYFVTSIMHQMFGFKDIKPDENIFDYRGKEGNSDMYAFPINDILEKLLKKFPNNYKLNKGLGDYYYEVHLKYGDNWLKKNDELFELIEKNYSKAISHNEFDYLSFYALGYVELNQKKYKESIPNFSKSISLNNTYPSAYYNQAYAYLFLNERDSAILKAKKSLDLYNDRSYKGDAARMIAEIYEELKNDQKAIEYYELSNSIDSNNYYTLKPMLYLYVKAGSVKVGETTNTFYNLAPDKPTIYNDLSSIYFENNKSNELADFYKSNLIKYDSDPKIIGNLNFYLGRLYFEKDKKLATEYFIKSKEIFSKIYDKDNQVFKVIDDAIKRLK